MSGQFASCPVCGRAIDAPGHRQIGRTEEAGRISARIHCSNNPTDEHLFREATGWRREADDEPWCECGHLQSDHPRDGRCGAALEERCDCQRFIPRPAGDEKREGEG